MNKLKLGRDFIEVEAIYLVVIKRFYNTCAKELLKLYTENTLIISELCTPLFFYTKLKEAEAIFIGQMCRHVIPCGNHMAMTGHIIATLDNLDDMSCNIRRF